MSAEACNSAESDEDYAWVEKDKDDGRSRVTDIKEGVER